MINVENMWEEILKYLKDRITEDGFHTWIEPIKAKMGNEGLMILEVPNNFFVEWISEHYLSIIKEAAKQCGISKIQFEIVPKKFKFEPETEEKKVFINYGIKIPERFTFDNFVVGECNRFAFAACRRVCEGLGKYYNPLFIYGGVGLGKTHLICSIGNYVKKHYPYYRIFYTSAENFFLELIQAIQENSIVEFRNKYRSLDLLLIDDIHYLVGKERLQEELFHNLNYLQSKNVQVVFTSDRPPKEIPTLEERLISRLNQGLVCDIQPPDLETRIAIINKKAEEENVSLRKDVIIFLAERIKTNIRELEGALKRVILASQLRERDLSIEEIEHLLKDLLQKRNGITIEDIVKEVSKEFGLEAEILKSPQRNKNISLARQVAMYLCRRYLNMSLLEIGSYFGKKDHTTVLYACCRIEEMRKNDIKFSEILTRIINKINSV
ncbi:MAG: chromosomal replication initiator protein DnaA [candidate division WOR-3 bacterium]|nr:chromosomal replication initiator protein DnaA [candidate division WOR-3 bacterium]MCX7836521.1 chromosomal replication initiator protein DnaA [candidate division WOR-3 bacterium]MDW8113759.1 chromosomal replication initiator protein DnaA [candidate division WOR-3 bacterium]